MTIPVRNDSTSAMEAIGPIEDAEWRPRRLADKPDATVAWAGRPSPLSKS
jgi:hypothetical protein